jgi:hypothetical protein
MTDDQIAGLLSALAGISILVASYFQWFDITYDGRAPLRWWPKVLFALMIALQVVAVIFLLLS